MTVPFTDWATFFNDPEAKQRELNQFNAMVDLYRQSFNPRPAMQPGTAQGVTFPQAQQVGAVTPAWHDDDLVGAAAYWGMPEDQARAMPREALIGFLNEKRSARQQVTVDDKLMKEALIGAGQGVVHGLFNLPVIGESMRRVGLLQHADYKLHKMEEAMRATLPEDSQWMMTGANVAGNVASMWYPAAGAWAVAGKFGQIIPFLKGSRTALTAFQGGASVALLEGGSDAFKENPALFLGVGAGLGVAGDRVAQWLSKRITKSFVPSDTKPPAPPGGPPGSPPPTGPQIGPIVKGSAQFREAMVPPIGPELPPGGLPRSMGPTGPSDEGTVLSGADTFFGFRMPEANALASQLNKSATIVQSPVFPEIAGQTQINDVSVLAAAEATNPGGAQVIQGVLKPSELIEAMPANTHFVPRDNRLDALVLPPEIDPNIAIQQYQQFGLFEGQKILSPEGLEGVIRSIDRDGVVFTPAFGGPDRELGHKAVQGWLTSGVTTDAPGVWNSFVHYASQRAQATAGSMQAGFEAITSVVRQNLSIYADDFLTELGVANPGERAKLINYFNRQYVQSFRNLAPEESLLQDAALANYNSTATAPQTSLQSLDELAASKGYIAIPDGTAIIVKDLSASAGTEAAQFRFDTIETATDWVRQINRELPDVTPAAEVPLEVMGMVQRTATQGANLNGRSADHIAAAVSEMSTADGGAGFIPPEAVLAQAGGGDNIGRLKNLWSDGFNRWMPMRRFFSKIDQAMVEAGMPTGIAGDVDHMSQRIVQHHNDMHPFMDELTDITRQIKTDRLVSGEWSRLMMLPPGEREVAAATLGLPSKEIEAFGQMDDLLRRVVQHVNGSNAEVDTAEIWDYFASIARRQSDPETLATAYEYHPLSESTQAFHDFAQTSNMNFRELDPRHVGEGFIRALFWQKNMAEPWGALAEKWRGLAKTTELAPAAEYMKNWLKIVRYGYSAEDDTALDMLHGALRTFLGPEVSRQQAREVFSFGLNSTHSGMLGFRPHVMARDALQLFLAVPRAGADLLRVVGRFAGSEDARKAIMDEAIAEGAVTLQSPRMASPGSLTGELEQLSVAPGEAGMGQVPLDQSQYGWRMQTAAKVQAAVRDLMPTWLRDTRDSPLHALYFYGKQSEVMRALVYTAGKEKAATALAEFRAGGSADLAGLMGSSGARTFDPSWQREFQKLVAAGDDQGAARFIGRQLTDATQFKYGIVESPWAAKSLTGRVAMQMGNYQLQYLQYLRESLANGTLGDKAKLAMTFGAVTAGLEAATRETGWNFRWMNPFFGLGFTGGPWVTILPEVARAASDVAREWQGGNPNEAVRAAGAAALGQAAQNLNPLGGLIRTAQGVGEALTTSPYPDRAVGRLLTTGEMGNGPDVNQWLLPQATQMFQRSIQPQPSPVSATQIGLPPGVFPPQPAVYAPLVASPFQTMPQANQSPATPVPGGGSYGQRPAPGVSATYDDVNRAASGDPNALAKFSPDDRQLLSQLANVPPDTRMQIWSQYTAAKVNGMIEDASRLGVRNSALTYSTPEPFDSTQRAVHNVGAMQQLVAPGQSIDNYVQGVLSGNGGPPKASRDLADLNPDTQSRFLALQQAAQSIGLKVDVGETARAQLRQEALFRQGRSTPGPVVTWTLTSMHTGGDALDVIVNNDSTGRDPGYQQLHELAKTFGFVSLPGSQDPGHIAVTDSSRKAVPFTGAQQ